MSWTPTVSHGALTCLIKISVMNIALVRVSVVVKRHYNHGNYYRGKHFIEGWFASSEFIVIMAGGMVVRRIHGTGEVAGSPASGSADSREREPP